jgi:hypothetical protein
MGHCISIYVVNKSELRDDKINKVLSDKNTNQEIVWTELKENLLAYLLTISRSIKPEDIEGVIKTEKHILSKNFLNQRDFKDKDKESMIPIIRDYKLNSINI